MKEKKKTVLLFTVVASLVFIFGCATVKKDYQSAQQINSIEAYKEFLAKHPNSEYEKDIRERIEQFEWQKAKSLNTLTSYQNYLRKYSSGRFKTEVKAGIEKLHWEAAKMQNSISSYKEYHNQYPKGAFEKDARIRIEKMKWGKTKSLNTITAYDEYLAEYTRSKYSEEAKKRIDQIKEKEEKFRKGITFPIKTDTYIEPKWINNSCVVLQTRTAITMGSRQIYLGGGPTLKIDVESGATKKVDDQKYMVLSSDGKHGVFSKGETKITQHWGIDGKVTQETKTIEEVFLCDVANKSSNLLFQTDEEINGMDISDDCRRLVFSKSNDLWIFDITSNKLEQLTFTIEHEVEPIFHPNGKDMLFCKLFYEKDVSKSGIYRMSFSTKKSSKIIGPVVKPVFSLSGDGKFIVYSSNKGIEKVSNYTGNIWVMDIANGQSRKLSNGGFDLYPSVSPDGKLVAFSRQFEFYDVPTDYHVGKFQLVIQKLISP